MSKYWLFAGDNYYPAGGFKDFVDGFSNIEDAKKYCLNLGSLDWAHIVDMDSESNDYLMIVWEK